MNSLIPENPKELCPICLKRIETVKHRFRVHTEDAIYCSKACQTIGEPRGSGGKPAARTQSRSPFLYVKRRRSEEA